MSTLSWGKCRIDMINSVSGAPDSGDWTTLPTPKEGTTSLDQQEGEVTEAKEEGGAVVDRRVGTPTGVLTFQLFQKKGETIPITHHDGQVEGEKAFRVIPVEDTACPGVQLDKCRVTVVMSYSAADGILYTVNCAVLKPATGNMIKLYTVPAQTSGDDSAQGGGSTQNGGSTPT